MLCNLMAQHHLIKECPRGCSNVVVHSTSYVSILVFLFVSLKIRDRGGSIYIFECMQEEGDIS